MTKYFAFLRAINVGGHTVKMAALKQIFESLGFTNVETYIASGNITFASSSSNTKKLEKTIENVLKSVLGFETITFLRTEPELEQIARFQPFAEPSLKTAISVNVAFLKEPLNPAEIQTVMAWGTPADEFNVAGREVFWLVRTLQHESSFSNSVFEKTLKRKSTIRGMDKVRKMVCQDRTDHA